MNTADKPAGRIGGARQHTLRNPINCTGVGLHTGLKANMRLVPAAANHGIRFRRVDIDDRDNEIEARYDRVTDCLLSTSVGNDAGVKISTIEHLMAAFAGTEIDNVLVELDGPEVPVMDGSSQPFVFLIECAGRQEQAAQRKRIRVQRPIEVRDADAACSLLPSRGFSVGFEIDFESPAVTLRDGFFDLSNGAFKREIARARTFGFERDIRKLWELGLARGGSLENAVVVGTDDELMNDGGLRYADEFVRHKVLDAVGDLYLAGAPLLAHFQGERSGHALNNALLRALFADPTAWTTTNAVPEPSYIRPADAAAPAIA